MSSAGPIHFSIFPEPWYTPMGRYKPPSYYEVKIQCIQPTRRRSTLRVLLTGRDTEKLSARPSETSGLLKDGIWKMSLVKTCKKNPVFWSYIKSKRQESTGIAPLKNKDGFMHSDSSSKVEILNHQFVSAYTPEKIWPTCPLKDLALTLQWRKSMSSLLLDLKTHKATGLDSIPAFVLKVGAHQLSLLLTRLYQYSLDTGEIPGDWKNGFIQSNFNGSNIFGTIELLLRYG